MTDHIALAHLFCKGGIEYEIDGSIWKDALSHVLENHDQIEIDKKAVHARWIEYGGRLRDRVRDDELILSFLLLALPGYSGDSLTLYRGECRFLCDKGSIGFSWTPNVATAEIFASGLNAIESGGVLLRAFAPKEAILAAPNEHSREILEESEYTCNPKSLKNIEILKSYEKSA